jgi:hypothetical protein
MENEIINTIRENIHMKTNEIIWLPEIRKHNQSTSYILVLIEKTRNEKKTF